MGFRRYRKIKEQKSAIQKIVFVKNFTNHKSLLENSTHPITESKLKLNFILSLTQPLSLPLSVSLATYLSHSPPLSLSHTLNHVRSVSDLLFLDTDSNSHCLPLQLFLYHNFSNYLSTLSLYLHCDKLYILFFFFVSIIYSISLCCFLFSNCFCFVLYYFL